MSNYIDGIPGVPPRYFPISGMAGTIGSGLGSALYSPDVGAGSDIIPSQAQPPMRSNTMNDFWGKLLEEAMQPGQNIPWKVEVGDMTIAKKKSSEGGSSKPADIPRTMQSPEVMPTRVMQPPAVMPARVMQPPAVMPARVMAVPVTPIKKTFIPKSLEDFKKVKSSR